MLPFAFEAMGMIVFIGDTLAPWSSQRGDTPNVRFEFQPLAVATHGIQRVHEEALRILKALRGVVVGNQLSEIHVTADIETDRPHQPTDYHTSLSGLWKKVRTRPCATQFQVHEGAEASIPATFRRIHPPADLSR